MKKLATRREISIKNGIPKACVPIPWYTEEDYALTRAVMNDGGQLPTRYDKWRFAAETEERELREDGFHPVRVVVVPGKFVAWCSERMTHLNAVARRQYVQSIVEKQGL